MSKNWSPDSWKNHPAKQLPTYKDEKKLDKVLGTIKDQPPLVSAGECRNLKAEFAKAGRGEAFILQGGDCAESFKEYKTSKIMGTFNVLLQMNLAMSYAGGKPVVKVGRIGGQFAKPRSKEMEVKDGVELPSYKGDIINGTHFTERERTPNPKRMLQAYSQSASTVNFLRAMANGDNYSLSEIHKWTKSTFENSTLGQRHSDMIEHIDKSLEFMGSMHYMNTLDTSRFDFYTSHEALLLPYEEALTRQDSITSDWYDTSAHMLWIGDRTRQPDHAHVEFLSGVENPVGIKCGPTMDPEDLMDLLDKLNPDNDEGKIMLISRMGAGKVNDHLPLLIDTVEMGGYNVVWSCDPMHGNTHEASTGVKTRDFNSVKQEVQEFFAVHREKGTVAGGVHLEMTGHDVTECIGGVHGLTDNDLSRKYNTVCDPRLNAAQSLELAFLIGDELRKNEKGRPVPVR